MNINQLGDFEMSKTLNITSAAAALVSAASAAGHTLTEDKARELVKAANAKSMKRVNEIVATLGKKKNAGTRRIRSERKIEAGPRGFRISSNAWLESVKNAEGIAVHPSNLAKLKFHAKQMGVSSAGDDMVALCNSIRDAGLVPAETAAE